MGQIAAAQSAAGNGPIGLERRRVVEWENLFRRRESSAGNDAFYSTDGGAHSASIRLIRKRNCVLCLP